jgi:hypothetical protein
LCTIIASTASTELSSDRYFWLRKSARTLLEHHHLAHRQASPSNHPDL